MKVIGVVGGMGSGKSTVVEILSSLRKTYIISADLVGHEILKKDNLAYKPVLESFGPRILKENGQIDRKILGKIVFSDVKKLKKLNSISHPLIYQVIKEEINRVSKDANYDYIIIDAALLIEIGLIELVDQVWGVYAPLDTRAKRIMLRNGLSYEEARKRISSQLSWGKMQEYIDVEIDNSSSLELVRANIEDLLNKISKEE